MKLVEVVTHPNAAAEAVERAVTFAKALGKEPIGVKDSPGFASSRLGLALGLEAMRMLEQGLASAAAIDRESTRLDSRHVRISYAVFCFKKKTEPVCRQAD